MARLKQSPYLCHVFVCTNDRKGERKSCADGSNGEIYRLLKEEAVNRGWKPRVRISQSGCLGVCDAGPNVMLYPQREWFSRVVVEDLPKIINRIESILQKDEK